MSLKIVLYKFKIYHKTPHYVFYTKSIDIQEEIISPNSGQNCQFQSIGFTIFHLKRGVLLLFVQAKAFFFLKVDVTMMYTSDSLKGFFPLKNKAKVMEI